MKFVSLAVGLAIAIIGLIVFTSLLAGLYPSVVTALNAVNNSGKVFNASGHWTNTGYTVIPLRTLITSTGIIPLVIMAVVVIAIIIGLFAMIKAKNR